MAAGAMSMPPFISLPLSSSKQELRQWLVSSRKLCRLVRSAAAPGAAEFGARDPFPAELASNFANKVLGNASTEHVILVPTMPLALVDKSCSPLPAGASAMPEAEARALLRKVVGWRLVNDDADGGMKLQCEFKLKSFDAGIELFSRIAAVAKAEDYYPALHLEPDGFKALVEIRTSSVGGLSENDFILAAKIDKFVNTSDLIKRNRFWA